MPSEPDRYEPLPSLGELPSFLIRKLTPRRRRTVIIGGALLLVAAVAFAALVIPQSRSRTDERDAQAAHQHAVRLAALRAKYAREARPIAGRGPAADQRQGAAALAPRRALMSGLEAAVLADARERAQRGELRGHYRGASCYEYPKGVDDPLPADDLARSVAGVECIAATAKVPPGRTTTGSLIGQPYRARVDFPRGRYNFCKIVQVPGELSIQRDRVLDVPAACSAKA